MARSAVESQDELLEQLRATMGKLEVALGAVSDAIVWAGPEGRIQWCNRQFDQLVDRPHIAVLGRPLRELLPLMQEGQAVSLASYPTQHPLTAHPTLLGCYEFCRGDCPLTLEIAGAQVEAGPMQSTVLSIRDITERRQMENQLRQKTSDLEAFSYSVSHDLRSPLRAIEGFSGLLLEEYAGRLDAEGQRLLGVIRTNVRQMGHLISDLLTFSRIGRQAMQRVPVEMGALAQTVFEELRAAVPERTIRWELAPLPQAQGDPALLRQVWVDLLANAIKFTQPRSKAVIEVRGRLEGGEAWYSIKDNGAGFDMAYASKLFGVFQRLHTQEEFEGTGVGLAIVQQIVRRHGGRVWGEGALDQGATFSFTLPLTGGI